MCLRFHLNWNLAWWLEAPDRNRYRDPWKTHPLDGNPTFFYIFNVCLPALEYNLNFFTGRYAHICYSEFSIQRVNSG